jgi:hypothetical protein
MILSAVVMTTAALGYQMDGDARGQATLAWTGYKHDRKIVRVADVRDGHLGHKSEIWRGKKDANGMIESFDVSPGGAAVACLRVTDGRVSPRAWRVSIVRRPAGGTWGKPIRVRAKRIKPLVCATDDAGRVTVAWGLGGKVTAMAIEPNGRQEKPTTLAPDSVGSPQIAVSAAGAATVAYAVGRSNRALHVSERGPNGWASRAVAPAMLPELSMDGTGRAVVGWSDPSETGNRLRFAAAPTYAPQTLISEPLSTLVDVAASPRGDVLAAWQTNAWAGSNGPQEIRVILQRPGEAFGPPIALGPFKAYPHGVSLAADGSGAAGWNTGSWGRPKLVVRVLNANGNWAAPIAVPGADMQFVAAPGGRLTVAWLTKVRDRETLHVGSLP